MPRLKQYTYLMNSTNPEHRSCYVSHPKLSWIHLRYYPPGVVLEYMDSFGKRKEKIIDLLDLSFGTNTGKLCTEILNSEPLFSTHKQRLKLMECLEKLKNKCYHEYADKYICLKTLKPHSLPLTDACISKDGKRVVTSSLGNACKIWCTHTGKEQGTLMGHKDAVTSVNFNPTGDMILTSSHDGTLRHWSCGEDDVIYCNQVLSATDSGRVLFAKYSPDFQMAVSATDDNAACVHDLVNGVAMYKFSPDVSDRQEITSVNLDKTGTLLLASPHEFHQAALWDLRSGDATAILEGHEMEVTKSIFDFTSQLIATSSLDSTVKIWDIRMLDDAVLTLGNCDSEVLDIEFDCRGKHVVAGSVEGKIAVWNVHSGKCQFDKQAHKSSISKVGWSPNGAIVFGCSDFGTIRLYHSDVGTCLQTLPDHTREIVNAAFNYTNELFFSASKDKTVRTFKHTDLNAS